MQLKTLSQQRESAEITQYVHKYKVFGCPSAIPLTQNFHLLKYHVNMYKVNPFH